MEDPVTHVRKIVNSPSDNPPRSEASSFAVYSDGIAPVTQATVSPAPNAHGWNNSHVTVNLYPPDLASGFRDTPTGWVDTLQYSLSGAQTTPPQSVAGHSASVGV